jgi:hypothetical protein
MEGLMIGLHPDYGLTDELRVEALRSAARFGVKKAAALYGVSPASLYKWRKVPALVKQMMEGDDD